MPVRDFAYKIGDLANIKSGGPALTITKAMFGEGEGALYEVAWHDQVGCLQKEVLPEDALEPFTPKEAWEQ